MTTLYDQLDSAAAELRWLTAEHPEADFSKLGRALQAVERTLASPSIFGKSGRWDLRVHAALFRFNEAYLERLGICSRGEWRNGFICLEGASQGLKSLDESEGHDLDQVALYALNEDLGGSPYYGIRSAKTQRANRRLVCGPGTLEDLVPQVIRFCDTLDPKPALGND